MILLQQPTPVRHSRSQPDVSIECRPRDSQRLADRIYFRTPIVDHGLSNGCQHSDDVSMVCSVSNCSAERWRTDSRSIAWACSIASIYPASARSSSSVSTHCRPGGRRSTSTPVISHEGPRDSLDALVTRHPLFQPAGPKTAYDLPLRQSEPRQTEDCLVQIGIECLNAN